MFDLSQETEEWKRRATEMNFELWQFTDLNVMFEIFYLPMSIFATTKLFRVAEKCIDRLLTSSLSDHITHEFDTLQTFSIKIIKISSRSRFIEQIIVKKHSFYSHFGKYRTSSKNNELNCNVRLLSIQDKTVAWEQFHLKILSAKLSNLREIQPLICIGRQVNTMDNIVYWL